MDDTAPVVVVTDLDGTLLDHDTYRAGPAAGAIDRLQRAGVRIVCCSAKTRAEQQVHRRELAITGPFIVENGAAVHGDDGDALVMLGLPYAQVLAGLAAAAHQVGITVRGFADMSVEELARRTGLGHEAAGRARRRDYTEAFVIDQDAGGTEPDALAAALGDQGLSLQRGARFWTASGPHDKGMAVARLRTLLAAELGRAPRLYGIGDAHNDTAMLAAVDVAMLVRRPDGRWADLPVDDLHRLDGVGPQGWVQMARRLLGDFLPG